MAERGTEGKTNLNTTILYFKVMFFWHHLCQLNTKNTTDATLPLVKSNGKCKHPV